MKSSTKGDLDASVTLSPNPRLPLIITLFGVVITPSPIPLWLAIVVIVFGLFLLLQTFTLRLEFTSDALVVNQFGRELRRFPFNEWIAWRLLLPQLPGIFYFREKASPHLLPIIFDQSNLTNQLRQRVGHLEKPQSPSSTTP